MNSDWDVVPQQRNQERSSPEVNSRAILFRAKWCSDYQEMFGMVSRYLVSMVDACKLYILSTRDINIEVPLELY